MLYIKWKMTKTQLNIHQITGLLLLLTGEFLKHSLDSDFSYIFTLMGLLIFMLASKLNMGIILSIITYITGNILLIMHYTSYAKILRIAGVVGFIGFGLYQFVYKQKSKEIAIMFLSILIFLTGSLQLNWTFGIMLLITGLTGLLLGYTYRFFKKQEKNFEDYLKLVIAYDIIFLYYFTLMELPGHKIFLYSLYGLLMIWIGISLYKRLKSN